MTKTWGLISKIDFPFFVGTNEKNRQEKFGPERFTTDREKRGSQARTTPLMTKKS